MAFGTLYVIATPLGNLGDLSPRAAALLGSVHAVAAEDTRHSQRLLEAVGARPDRLFSYHAHSDERRLESCLEILREGHDLALISDAGTPAISDPGAELVARARSAGFTVVPIPGPSAVATALSASGLSAGRYLFLGFPPRKGSDRRKLLAEVKHAVWTVVFYEAANRLVDLLDDLAELVGGDRKAVVARELTKKFEELRDGSLAELAEHYRATPPRGEITLLIAASPEVHREWQGDPETVAVAAREWLAAGESRREVARRVSSEFEMPRNDAYRLVMELK